MNFRESYARAKRKLLDDSEICTENRVLFGKFLTFEEYKLKRRIGKPTLDENSCRTLLSYTTRLRVVNRWFKNKSWRSLTKREIRRVYDDLEEGRITKRNGQPLRDKRTYYKLVLRGKPFEMAGKKQIVTEVLQFGTAQSSEEVRFIKEEDFRRLVEVASNPVQRTLLWLCWDIGENSGSILQLRKCNLVRQVNPDTKEGEYLVNLPREILKRSRTPRSEPTNYRETVACLDQLLKDLKESDLLFDFGEGWAKKLLLRAVQRTGVRCLPAGQRPTLKDLRSSMACDLLSKGWSRDEVNARLGHTPSSREIDRYINYLAIDRAKPKQKMQESKVAEMARDLERMKEQLRLSAHRLRRVKELSDQRVRNLNTFATVQCQISMVTLQHQLGQVDSAAFSGELARLHRGLLAALSELEDDAVRGETAELPIPVTG